MLIAVHAGVDRVGRAYHAITVGISPLMCIYLLPPRRAAASERAQRVCLFADAWAMQENIVVLVSRAAESYRGDKLQSGAAVRRRASCWVEWRASNHSYAGLYYPRPVSCAARQRGALWLIPVLLPCFPAYSRVAGAGRGGAATDQLKAC